VAHGGKTVCAIAHAEQIAHPRISAQFCIVARNLRGGLNLAAIVGESLRERSIFAKAKLTLHHRMLD
jgi:hypothetical protein